MCMEFVFTWCGYKRSSVAVSVHSIIWDTIVFPEILANTCSHEDSCCLVAPNLVIVNKANCLALLRSVHSSTQVQYHLSCTQPWYHRIIINVTKHNSHSKMWKCESCSYVRYWLQYRAGDSRMLALIIWLFQLTQPWSVITPDSPISFLWLHPFQPLLFASYLYMNVRHGLSYDC